MDACKIGDMKLDLTPASNYPLPDLTDFLNLSFENYLVPIQFNISQFVTMLRKDSIDLDSSRVLLIDDEPSGIALIARRGWPSAAIGCQDFVRDHSKVGNLAPQTGDLLALGRRVEERHVLHQQRVDGGVGVLDLGAMSGP